MKLSRRFFLQNGALTLAGTAALPGFLLRSAQAQAQTQALASRPPRRRLVVVFQRGAADGLNIVVPYREKSYYALRPNIAIPQDQLLELDGNFGLHPALAPFKPLYDAGLLAVVHAAGLPDTTRSHFDAQDFMESGTPGLRSTTDGWLNRALLSEDLARLHRSAHQARAARNQARQAPAAPALNPAFRAIALDPTLPRTLVGSVPALALESINAFNVGQPGPTPGPAALAFESMYNTSGDQILHSAGQATFDAIARLRAANPAQYQPAPGVAYPGGEFGSNMRQIAQLFKADLGVEVAFTNANGWDTHQNQGSVNGQLANKLTDFSQAIAAFWRDLGDQAENVTLITMSEFGRTAKENGTGGTDHGHANAMFILGGHIKGSRVYGQWPGLEPEQLNEGRDLALTTDYRLVVSELIEHALGPLDLNQVFPQANLDRRKYLKFTAS